MEIEQYLEERVDRQLAWYVAMAGHARRTYVRVEWVLIVAASLTPVFVILNINYSKDHWLQWIPVVSSVLVAMLTGGLKTFRYDEAWTKYGDREARLKNEKYQFLTKSGTYKASEDPDTEFIERIETIINS